LWSFQEKPTCVNCFIRGLNLTQGRNRKPKGTLRGKISEVLNSIVTNKG